LLATVSGITHGYGATPSPAPNPNVKYLFDLWDGSQIVCQFLTNSLSFNSSLLGKFSIPLADINTISFTNNNAPGALLATNGNALSVQFASTNIPISTSFGNINMPTKLINKIESVTISTNTTLTNNLLSFWNFDGTNPKLYSPNGGSLTNALQTGNDGIGPVNSGTVVNGKIENAIGFGTNGNKGLYIPSGKIPILTTFTITAWVKLNYNQPSSDTNFLYAYSPTGKSIIADSWDGPNAWNFQFLVFNGHLLGTVGAGGFIVTAPDHLHTLWTIR